MFSFHITYTYFNQNINIDQKLLPQIFYAYIYEKTEIQDNLKITR